MEIKVQKEKYRGLPKVCILLSVFVFLTYKFTGSPFINLRKILDLGIDFQFNLLSISATIGGFLFTGISIFIATIENGRIKRLWDHNYLDNIYRVAFVGISLNVLTFFAALAMIIMVMDEPMQLCIIRAEITMIVVSLICFIWDVYYLIFVLKRTKKRGNDKSSNLQNDPPTSA